MTVSQVVPVRFRGLILLLVNKGIDDPCDHSEKVFGLQIRTEDCEVDDARIRKFSGKPSFFTLCDEDKSGPVTYVTGPPLPPFTSELFDELAGG